MADKCSVCGKDRKEGFFGKEDFFSYHVPTCKLNYCKSCSDIHLIECSECGEYVCKLHLNSHECEAVEDDDEKNYAESGDVIYYNLNCEDEDQTIADNLNAFIKRGFEIKYTIGSDHQIIILIRGP
jgi:hypothetical protein